MWLCGSQVCGWTSFAHQYTEIILRCKPFGERQDSLFSSEKQDINGGGRAQSLKEGNYVATHHPQMSPNLSADYMIDTKATISSDSLVGSSSRVGERTSIKKSIIGSHCIIGKNVKISGCVIMDHTVVKDGYVVRKGRACTANCIDQLFRCKLDNSIFSRHMTIDERCSVKDCEAATGVVLAAGGAYFRLVTFIYF